MSKLPIYFKKPVSEMTIGELESNLTATKNAWQGGLLVCAFHLTVVVISWYNRWQLVYWLFGALLIYNGWYVLKLYGEYHEIKLRLTNIYGGKR